MDSSPADPRRNVAFDAGLFHGLEKRDVEESLRFWETREPAVIVGLFGAIGREIHEEVCRADGVPVIRRASGGGTVVIGPGCLNYSLVLSLEARPELRDVSRSYRLILGHIVDALDVPGLEVDGVSDLVIASRKVAGSAQRRGRRALLHHGTLLYAFDAAMMERYLKEPDRQPAYRAQRRHAAFVANAPIDPATFKGALVHCFVSRSPSRTTERAAC